MALAQYLSQGTICMDLQTAERDEAVRLLIELLAGVGKLPKRLVGKAVKVVIEREKLGSTAIGRGLAVPHARLGELKEIVMAFGYSRQGVAFNALDGQPVHQIFLIMAPHDGGEEYIAAMQRITHLVQNEDFRRFLSRATESRTVLELIEEMDK